MSVNSCTNDDLDLNSDAVTLDEQNEVSMVNVSESTITVNISATETITEPQMLIAREIEPVDREGDETEGDRFDGLMSQKIEVEVAEKVEFSITIMESSCEQTHVDVGGEAVLMGNEEVLSPIVEVPETDALNVSLSCSGKYQNLKVEMVGGSTVNNSAIHEDPSVGIESSLNGDRSNEEDLSSKVEVPETDALDVNLHCSGKEENLKVEMVGGSTENNSALHENPSVCAGSSLNGDLSNEEDLSPKFEVPETDAPDVNLHCSGKDENLKVEMVGGSTENNSSIHEDPSVCAESSINGDLSNEEDLSPKVEVPETDVLDVNLHCSGKDHNLKVEMVGGSTENNSVIHEDPSVGAESSRSMDLSNEEDLSPKVDIPKTDELDENLYCSGKDQNLKVEMVSGITENDSAIHEDPSVCAESRLNGELRTTFLESNSYGQVDNTSMQHEKQDTVAQVAETLSSKVDGDQSGDSYPVEEIPNQGTCVTVNSISFAGNAVGSQAAATNAFLHGEGEPYSSRVTEEFVGLLPDNNFDAEVQGVESISNRDIGASFLGTNLDSQEENVSVQDEKQEMVAQVDETLIKVDGDLSVDAYPVEDLPDHGTCDTIDSNSFAENIVASQAAVACASPHGEGGPDCSQVTEFLVPLLDNNLDTKVQGIEYISNGDLGTSFLGTNSDSQEVNTSVQDEKQETFAQVSEVRLKVVGNQSPDSYRIEEILDQGTCVTVNSNSFAENTVESQDTVACASSRGEVEPDSSRVSEFVGPLPDCNPGTEVQGVESIPNADLRTSFMETNSGIKEDNTFMQDEKQETIAQVAETLSNKLDGDHSMDSYPIEEILDQSTCATVNKNTSAEVTVGSQAAVACASLHVEGEFDSSRVTEIVGLFPDSNLAAEVQVADTHNSVLHEDQNLHTHVFEFVTNHGVQNQAMEAEAKAKGGCCETDANQIMSTHASKAEDSQLSGDDSNTGSLVVDLDAFPITDGNYKSGDEVVKEDIYPPDGSQRQGAEVKEMGGDVGFSMLRCLDENAACDVTQVGSNENQEIDIEEQVTDLEQLKEINKKIVKQGDLQPSCVKEYQASYCLPPESESEFSVHDLVWGKVRSHPWWPGQIFDPSDSSEQAIRYHKKDSFLVAYFGDRTFAWNEASLLKPFRTHFSQMENQSNVEAFHDAVGCALKEVSRRVELGLSCSCMPEEDYAKIKSQIIENTGILEESSRKDYVCKSTSVVAFEPKEFVKYIKALARFPSGVGNKLEFVIAKAQLLAFYRSKGYCRLPEFQICGGLLDNDAVSSFSGEKHYSNEVVVHATSVSKDKEQVPYGKGKSKSQDRSFRKRKHDLEDSLYPNKKERSLSELMAGEKASLYVPHGQNESDGKSIGKSVSLPSGKIRKAIDSFSEGSEVQKRKKGLPSPGAAITVSPSPKQSFKVGECIRRVASQLTGSSPILKCSSESFQKDAAKVNGSRKKPTGTGFDVSPHEMLSQLCLAARDPMKGYSFVTIIISFFSDFRNSVSLDQSDYGKHKNSREKVGGGKTGSKNKQSSNANTGSAETFAFVDMKDSYWTDMVIQSSPEEQPSRKNQNRKGESQLETTMENDMPFDEPEISPRLSPNWDSEQQNPDGNHEMTAEKPGGYVNVQCREDFSPTALILSFAEVDSVPSETNLNKIFNRFGPLRESETEVLRETSCATVVFKRRSDAEVAFSSAGKFSIFGPVFVSYQLRYLSSTPSKASSLARTQVGKDATSMEGHKT
ncbi:hypothetical protein HHK36_010855 [Tetracentron sinense]|uniref:PWWP domain-containing protein n=1 Tax=Tetracentron sinense TaxID=13715 RepID=A0A834ZB88_TETSI|nr:hypothetical protein HHK36_010855 [Tetracentron sinense]